MSPADLSLDRLRAYIGRELDFDGHHCRIVEFLEDGPALVLSCETAAPIIQPNQHGDATRRVAQTRTVPILTPDGNELHADFLKLNLSL